MKEQLENLIATGTGGGLFKSLVLFFSFIASTFLGGWDMTLRILVIVVTVDFITGILAGAYLGQLSSAIGYKGIIKKVTIFLIVSLACMADYALSMTYIRDTTIYFYIVMELLSIAENAEKTGIPLPPFLVKILKQAKDNANQEDANVNTNADKR
jgi:toxin secretion/phage lysis holin